MRRFSDPLSRHYTHVIVTDLGWQPAAAEGVRQYTRAHPIRMTDSSTTSR